MKTPTLITNPKHKLIPYLDAVAVALANEPILPGELRTQLAKRETDRTTRQGKAKSRINVSEIGDCARQIACRFFPDLFTPLDNIKPETRKQWEVSSAMAEIWHTRTQAAIVASLGPAVLTERWLSDLAPTPAIKKDLWDLWLTGRPDVYYPSDSHEMTEIKTVQGKDFNPHSRFFFSKLKLEQSHLTMWALDIPVMRYVVLNRDSNAPLDTAMEYEMERDNETIEELLGKAATIKECVEAVKEFMAEVDKGHFTFTYEAVNRLMPDPEPQGEYYCQNLCGLVGVCPAWK